MSRRQHAAAWIAYAVALLAVPFLLPSGFGLALACQACIAIVACLSFNLLFGQGGMLSFGHAVYTGFGAYVAIHAMNASAAGRIALPTSLVPLVGGVGGMAASVVLGYLATRRGGTGFAMITLGLGELVFALASMMTGFFGGEGGVAANRIIGVPFMGITFGPPREIYALTAGWCLVSTAAMYGMTRAPFGRLLNAVRDNPERAAFIGLSPAAIRYQGFIGAGFFAGVSGGLYALNVEIVTPDVLSTLRSANILLFAMLGGSTVFGGPVLGGVLMVLCGALLPGITRAWLLYLGIAFMAMMMVEPGGVTALLARGAGRFTVLFTALRASRRADVDQGQGASIARRRRLFEGAARLASRGVSALVAFFAGAVLIEMLYRVRLDAALGPTLRFAGFTLDTSSSRAWIVSSLCLVASVGLWQGTNRWRPGKPERATAPGDARRGRPAPPGFEATGPA